MLQLFRGTTNWSPEIRAAQGIEMSGSEIRIKHSLKGSPVKTLSSMFSETFRNIFCQLEQIF